MSRIIFALLLFLTCLLYPSCSLSTCVSLDVDKEVAEWKCPDFANRSGAKKGTIEHKLSVACSWYWNVLMSFVLGALDLAFAAFINGWELSKSIITFFWASLLTALDWLWNTALKGYAGWAIHSIGALWEWWYPTVWKGLVVAAWDTFFLLGILAFLAYCVWAVVGLPICVIATIALLVSIAIVFLLVCLAIAVTFVVLAAIILVSLLLALVCALLLTVVSVISLLLTIVVVGIMFLIGFILILLLSLFAFFIGWILIQGLIGSASVSLLAATAKLAHVFKAEKNEKAEGKIWGYEVNPGVYLSYKCVKNIALFSAQFFIALCFFLCDLSIVNDSTDAFMTGGHSGGIFETLPDNSEWLGKLPGYQVITSLGTAFSFTLSVVSTRTIEYFDWKCPGPYFLLHSSQVAIGVFVLLALQTLQFKAEVTTMKSKSVNMQFLNLIAELTTR